MTPQEIFDTVARHLLTQGKPAFDAEYNQCLYHAKDGLKCAAGCLIPDELYNVKMEGKRIRQILVDNPKLCDYLGIDFIHDNRGVGHETAKLVTRLQAAHDEIALSPENPVSFNVRVLGPLHAIAMDYGLAVDVLNEFQPA